MGASTHYPYSVILGLLPPGLSVIRELGKAGIPLCGVTNKNKFEFGKVSRYLNKVIEYADWDDLTDKLIAFARNQKNKPLLIPMYDDYIFFIADYYQVLVEYYVIQSSYKPQSIRSIVDKQNFYEFLASTSIPFPTTWYLKDNEAIEEKNLAHALPLIAKPRLIHKQLSILRGNKVVLLKTGKDLHNFYKDYSAVLSEWLIQDIIPGPASNIFVHAGYANKKGRPLIRFTGRKLRQRPADFGVGAMIVSEPNQEVEDLSDRCLAALKFHGLYETEFKFDDRDGQYKMMEVNPRAPLWIGLASAAGIQINYTAFLDLCSMPQPEISLPAVQPILWIYWERYILGLFDAAARKDSGLQKGLSHMPRIKRVYIKRTGPVWSVTDPKPALSTAIFYLNKIRKRLLK